ncbi:protein kinase [Streptomyces sp. NPDC086549]|uniref:protein kinase n=1 Tax=Streptomyces sp. NPDC086549 TaxID=3365752 RepID=UPI003818E701
MDDYAGRVLADRYRLPLPPSDEYELTETRAFDTYSGQEVLVRQVPLPEVVEAEVLDADGLPEGFTARDRGSRRPPTARTATRRPADPAVRRAVEAAQAAARVPDHPRLDQVFDVFAEGGSLWIVSELVSARPLAALLTEKPLTPYRAAEVASDVLMALRVLHAHGWVHRNITARTVLVCDDGRVMLTGLAVGAAEEALCGYDPVPDQEGFREGPTGGSAAEGGGSAGRAGAVGAGGQAGPGGTAPGEVDPETARRAAIQARAAGGLPGPGADGSGGAGTSAGAPAPSAPESGADIRAARAGAIAAYRAGARAAARVQEAQQNGRAALPGARPPAEGDTGAAARADGTAQPPYVPVQGGDQGRRAGTTPPGQIADPYGVHASPWRGASPRTTPGGERSALPPAGAAPGTFPVPGEAGHTAVPPPASGTGPGAGPAPAPALDADGLLPAPALPSHPGRTPASHNGAGGAPSPALPAQAGRAPALPPHTATGTGTGAPRPPARWDDLAAATPARRGPATAIAAERARQVRMTVVGPVTERWAPEQAGPVHENWQLAAPIGPATDLWALGALLFRSVQGHAPYPEESTAELVQLVCAEPPAFAEECGPLRPVVESLLRADPTERPEFEELRGWLRSLVRSAPEPEAGAHVVAAPPADPSRLPIVRRRGELVRRRRAGLPATSAHGRHKRAKEEARAPRSLGRTLLLLILLLLAGAVAYAMLFMPKADSRGAASGDRTGAAGQVSQAPETGDKPTSGQSSRPSSSHSASTSAPSTETQTTTDPSVADGFVLRKDPESFQVAVAKGWDRAALNGRGQVVYSHGDFELIVVPGRDRASKYGSDPMAYQRDKESELQPYRDSSWATATGLRTIEVGDRTMAEGQFTWTDDQGRDLFVRNIAILIDGRYHVVQVRGPEAERDEVTRLYEQASATYKYTG